VKPGIENVDINNGPGNMPVVWQVVTSENTVTNPRRLKPVVVYLVLSMVHGSVSDNILGKLMFERLVTKYCNPVINLSEQ
jgi:hypothetical protein